MHAHGATARHACRSLVYDRVRSYTQATAALAAAHTRWLAHALLLATLILACWAVLPASAAQLDQDRKLALVIGNNDYSLQPLANAVNDARAMAKTLQSLGFEVLLRENVGRRQFRRELRDFAYRVQREDGVALFYYAGHAVQIDGRNFLLPTDAALQDEEEMKDDSVDLDDTLLRQIERSRKRLTMIVLDACRNNPFARGRGRGGGLATIEAPPGTLIAFSTGPGRTADDGDGPNGLYTSVLLNEIRREGSPVEQVFKRTGREVAVRTRNQQVPWTNSNFYDEFSFTSIAANGPAAPPAVDTAAEAVPVQAAAAELIVASVSLPARTGTARPQTAEAPRPSAEPVATDPAQRYREAALRGDATAAVALGRMYARGSGVARSDEEAVRWLRLAADAGNAEGNHLLGVALASGRGTAKDNVEAAQRYRRAAEQGHAAAQNNLGTLYALGQGVAMDQAEAVRWYVKSAEQGFALAQTNLAIAYAQGPGVPPDEQKSLEWFRRAALQGNAVAQFNLGVLYAKGQGVAADDVQATAWYRRAADQGLAAAQYELARAYSAGRGVARDEAEAIDWYRKAALQGHPPAVERLKGTAAASLQ